MSPKSILGAGVALALFVVPVSAAKQDIRGAKLGMTRDDARRVLVLNGYFCQPENDIHNINCEIFENGEKNNIELLSNANFDVWKIDYVFYFHTNVANMASYIAKEYGLKPLPIAGRYRIDDKTTAAIQTVGNRASFLMVRDDLIPRPKQNPAPPILPRF